MTTPPTDITTFGRALVWVQGDSTIRHLECRYDDAYGANRRAIACLVTRGVWPGKYMMRGVTMDEALTAVLDLYYRSHDEG